MKVFMTENVNNEEKSKFNKKTLEDYKKKNKKLKLSIFIILILISILGSFFIGYNLSKINKKENTISDSELAKTSNSSNRKSSKEVKPSPGIINWKVYKNEKYEFMKFKYPQGAEIEFLENDPSLCGEISGCFSLEMNYKKMNLKVERITGIGGMPRMFSSPYSIISGNQNKGIGKTVEEVEEEDKISIQYFSFKEGAQTFGGFLVNSASFTFSMPENSREEYEPIADKIACSVLDETPLDEEKYARAYLDRKQSAVVGIEEDGNEYIILQANAAQDEKLDNAVLNPAKDHLAIITYLGKGTDAYLHLYNLNSQNFVNIEGESMLPTIGDPKVWVDDYTVLNVSNSKYYKINVKEKQRIEISSEKYSELMKEN